jgi:hypothetical protein
MSLMVFFADADGRAGSGSVLKVKRPKGSLVVEYEYVWDGQHHVGSWTGHITAHGAWFGDWADDDASGGPPHWRGDALMVEGRQGALSILSGTWQWTWPKPKRPRHHPWLLVLR